MVSKKTNFKFLLAIILLLSGAIAACGDRHASQKAKTQGKAAVAQNSTADKPVQLEYGDLWQQPRSEYVIIPVGYKVRSNKRIVDSLSGYVSKSAILRGQSLSAVNLIFHGHKNDTIHLLLEKNAFITEFDYLVDTKATANEIKPATTASSCKPPAKTTGDHSFQQLMVYKIVEQDTNQNQVLDLEDANKGYLSDLTGKNLRSLTPDRTQLIQWHCDYQRERLLLFVRELNLPLQKQEINPLALYLYDLPTSKLTRITPPQSNLENWNINLSEGRMYLYSRLDGNSDRQYNSQDETRVIKYNLDTQQSIEINNPQIRESLNSKQ